MFSRRLTRSIAIGATAIALGGGAYGIVSATASTGSGAASAAASPLSASGQPVPRGGGSNARSGPAAGGSSGTVDSVSKSSFTISTSAGQKVTVKKASSTTYRKGTSSRSASAITKGESVLVLGITNGTTITASQVIVQPTGGRRIYNCLRGGPLPAWCTVHVKAGRSDPSELQSGVGYDRQRNGRE
jgi:Domain of unknown function (DUF5666)